MCRQQRVALQWMNSQRLTTSSIMSMPPARHGALQLQRCVDLRQFLQGREENSQLRKQKDHFHLALQNRGELFTRALRGAGAEVLRKFDPMLHRFLFRRASMPITIGHPLFCRRHIRWTNKSSAPRGFITTIASTTEFDQLREERQLCGMLASPSSKKPTRPHRNRREHPATVAAADSERSAVRLAGIRRLLVEAIAAESEGNDRST